MACSVLTRHEGLLGGAYWPPCTQKTEGRLTGKVHRCRPCRISRQAKAFCQEWDLNPRSFELRPERSALDRSAILTLLPEQLRCRWTNIAGLCTYALGVHLEAGDERVCGMSPCNMQACLQYAQSYPASTTAENTTALLP